MAVEPLGSVMTMQMQAAPAPKPVAKPAEKVEPGTESGAQVVERVDQSTNVVENAQNKGQGNNSPDQKQDQMNSEQIRKTIEKLNKRMMNSEAIFGIHEDTNRVTIKIVDKDTKEVIKELPPEKTLDMIAKAWELAGILVDERR
ncbi:MAG: flagellar protein FlaG [Butyrivibrio sp.]|nr:flagellar protein FlaG [Muribaculum sp.]MCM1551357.1 flagellar protein FlaG [Butyrivibrio sp.]